MSTTRQSTAVPDPSGDHVLEGDENERIFQHRILPDELTGSSQQQPVVVIVAGQPGDGKATITALVQDVLSHRGGPVTISADRYEPHHPGFHALTGEAPTADWPLSIDGRRWLAKAEAHVRAERFDVVMESVPAVAGDFEEPARRFKAAGYQVEVALVAVSQAVSRFGTLDRHVRALYVHGYGRYADPAFHDACYRGVLRAAEAVDGEHFADRVAVLRPDGELIYGNQRTADGRWQQPARTAAAVTWERDRPATVAESRTFLDGVTAMEQLGLTAPFPWLRREAVEGARTVAALAAPRLHPDAVTLHKATAGVPLPGL